MFQKSLSFNLTLTLSQNINSKRLPFLGPSWSSHKLKRFPPFALSHCPFDSDLQKFMARKVTTTWLVTQYDMKHPITHIYLNSFFNIYSIQYIDNCRYRDKPKYKCVLSRRGCNQPPYWPFCWKINLNIIYSETYLRLKILRFVYNICTRHGLL